MNISLYPETNLKKWDFEETGQKSPLQKILLRSTPGNVLSPSQVSTVKLQTGQQNQQESNFPL